MKGSRAWWQALARDEAAQDVIEYAFLTAFVGLAGLVVFMALAGLMGGAYGSWDAGVSALWVPDPPASP